MSTFIQIMIYSIGVMIALGALSFGLVALGQLFADESREIFDDGH